MRPCCLAVILCLPLLGQDLHDRFVQPPSDARIMMRWWWFGAAVEKEELRHELSVMKAAGIGGVEIQPVYPLELDDPARGIKNRPFLSPEFLDALSFAAKTARSLGMRVDITLGSGWPYGGPHTLITEAAGHLRYAHVPVYEGTKLVPLPAMENGERLIGAFLGGKDVTQTPGTPVLIPDGLSGNDLLEFFIASRTGQQVKRAALGAEGFVLDHYDRRAIDAHLSAVADLLLKAFGDQPPLSVFSDSLEVYGSDWTPNFLEEFQRRRGYDLTPYLPQLVDDEGRDTLAFRHDWAKTLSELAEDNYLKPIAEWAHRHGTLFRSQTYGEPPVTLSSNALVDLPEGEHGPSWRRFSAARWASSACHLYGKPITSTETWTWLHSPAFRATPLDMKAEADRHFIEGINQFVGHGWPYSPPSAGEPGWRFYAAAAFNDHNPWFAVMPDIALYLARVSFLLRQGEPANDIAIYVPTDDGFAHSHPGKVAVDEIVDKLLGPSLIPQVLNAGYNFDFIDDRAMAKLGVPYRILILPALETIPLETLQRIESYISRGGVVVATGTLPAKAPGFLEGKRDTARVGELVHKLFESGFMHAQFVANLEELPDELHRLLPPDLLAKEAAPSLGFIHRKLPSMEIYFIANTSNRALDTHASIRLTSVYGERWDPFSGTETTLPTQSEGAATQVHLQLAPYESTILVFTKVHRNLPAEQLSASNESVLDLTSDWEVSFPSMRRTEHIARLGSWTLDESTRFYSGQAVYRRDFNVSSSMMQKKIILLDFGPGTPVEPTENQETGMRALLESPIHEYASVVLNGKQVGDIWKPPYQIDLTGFVHAGQNHLQITVGNLAINHLAQFPASDYHLLEMRYGARFTPQDEKNLKPLPAGITGFVHLVSRSR
ncbi:MAG TPA: glycosyl hydrolase [Bryobacteraceae bacterium]|nr:glycosyl hydrolase [Bryobacteraceae bacterium]